MPRADGVYPDRIAGVVQDVSAPICCGALAMPQNAVVKRGRWRSECAAPRVGAASVQPACSFLRICGLLCRGVIDGRCGLCAEAGTAVARIMLHFQAICLNSSPMQWIGGWSGAIRCASSRRCGEIGMRRRRRKKSGWRRCGSRRQPLLAHPNPAIQRRVMAMWCLGNSSRTGR